MKKITVSLSIILMSLFLEITNKILVTTKQLIIN